MAFALNTRTGRGRYRPLAEINVTPLVDVMLVLLIIFMVTAPLMTSGVSVDLPKTNAQQINSDSQPLTVTVNAQGDIYLQDQQVDLDELVAKLQAISQNNPDRRIFVRGDKDLAYGRIMQVMGTITLGGFTKVALLAQQTGLPPPPTAAPTPGTQPAAGTQSAAPAPTAPATQGSPSGTASPNH
ncbi:MAG TPA: protein TolR [Acetobacteraceae bacterium]|nr:protein TolR [Acetobacteraceae bacterium]